METVGDLYMDVAEACAENGTKLYKMTSLGSFVVCLTTGSVCGLSTAGSPDLEVRGSSLVRRVVSLYKELYSTLSLFTQVYKWVQATYCWGVPCDGLASRPGGSSNTAMHATGIITSCVGPLVRVHPALPYLHLRESCRYWSRRFDLVLLVLIRRWSRFTERDF